MARRLAGHHPINHVGHPRRERPTTPPHAPGETAMARRRYTQAERTHAAGIAAVEGVTAAERATGVPKETIQYWITKPEFAHLRTNARSDVAEAFYIAVQVGLKQVFDGLQSDAPLRDKAQALGIIYDRYALLTGQATNRSESRDLTNEFDDAEKLLLRDAIDGELERRVAERSTPGTGTEVR